MSGIKLGSMRVFKDKDGEVRIAAYVRTLEEDPMDDSIGWRWLDDLERGPSVMDPIHSSYPSVGAFPDVREGKFVR